MRKPDASVCLLVGVVCVFSGYALIGALLIVSALLLPRKNQSP